MVISYIYQKGNEMSFEKQRPYILPKAKDVVFGLQEELESLRELLVAFAFKYNVKIHMRDAFNENDTGLSHVLNTKFIGANRIFNGFFSMNNYLMEVSLYMKKSNMELTLSNVLNVIKEKGFDIISIDGDVILNHKTVKMWSEDKNPNTFCLKFLFKCLLELLKGAFHGNKEKDLWDIDGYGELHCYNFKLLAEFIFLNDGNNSDSLYWYNQKLRSPIFQRDVNRIYNVANLAFERLWHEMCRYSTSPNWLVVELTQTIIPTQLLMRIEGDYRLIDWFKQQYAKEETERHFLTETRGIVEKQEEKPEQSE